MIVLIINIVFSWKFIVESCFVKCQCHLGKFEIKRFFFYKPIKISIISFFFFLISRTLTPDVLGGTSKQQITSIVWLTLFFPKAVRFQRYYYDFYFCSISISFHFFLFFFASHIKRFMLLPTMSFGVLVGHYQHNYNWIELLYNVYKKKFRILHLIFNCFNNIIY